MSTPWSERASGRFTPKSKFGNPSRLVGIKLFPHVFAFCDGDEQARALADDLGIVADRAERRAFQDGESLVRVPPTPADAETALLFRSLNDPKVKIVEILFAAALRASGARRVAVSAAPALAAALARDIEPGTLLIGPAGESAPWVERIATPLGLAMIVVEKWRSGDRDVALRLLEAPSIEGRTAVIIDDIVSSGSTLIACAASCRGRTARPSRSIARRSREMLRTAPCERSLLCC